MALSQPGINQPALVLTQTTAEQAAKVAAAG